jgi:aldehyde dehydrogenase (NAD+)
VTDKVQVASEADVDRAVAAAQKAFPAWRDTKAEKRGFIMLKYADLLQANIERLAKLESIAMGQPITLAKGFIVRAIEMWRYYAGFAGKVAGASYPPDADGSYKIVQYEPLGVCAGICAWNGESLRLLW